MLTAILGGCAGQVARPPLSLESAVGPRPINGIASWYGPGFDGHRTSSGAIYNQEDLSAASLLFPLGTTLRVTNLQNQRTIEVLINDHGPYVHGRDLDLSHRAAMMLGVVRPGTAPVRMEVLTTPPGGPALGERYYVQVGSFSDPANAQLIAARFVHEYPDVQVIKVNVGESRYYRVWIGAFTDWRTAQQRASLISRAGFEPIVVTQ